MISIIVKYYSVFCMAANFCREEELQLNSEADLWNLVEYLVTKYGEDFRKKLIATSGMLLPSAWVLVNGKRINITQFGRALNNGDTVIFTTPLLVGG